MIASIARRPLSGRRAPTPAAHARIPRPMRRGARRQVIARAAAESAATR